MSEHTPSGTQLPSQYRPVGVALAVASGVFIGASFVVKKKGLIASQGGHAAGEGVAYLKNAVWWTGMIMMIAGEIMNFGAYAFVEAIVVTPLGALSVVVCAILSSWFLKEKLTTLGWLACAECIFGSIIIALNGPREDAVATIQDFKEIFLAPWFLTWGSLCLATCLALIIFAVPRWGEKTMLVYVVICSLFGGLSVSCIQGLGAAILTTIRGENQFKNWFIYFLIVFVISTLLAEIFYLNKALALFNTAMVTPTYYVIFTFCVIVTSAILYQGFKASASTIITLVLAFLTICAGITLLQLSRVDPKKLNVDEKTNLLLAANQQEIENPEAQDPEKAIEDPGIDALRAFGTLGTINRARRRTIYDDNGNIGARPPPFNCASVCRATTPPRPMALLLPIHSSRSLLPHMCTTEQDTSRFPTRDPPPSESWTNTRALNQPCQPFSGARTSHHLLHPSLHIRVISVFVQYLGLLRHREARRYDCTRRANQQHQLSLNPRNNQSYSGP
ncbi:hypothetical protein M408DRAFT_260161 [Serendipita vermifera MAFF 305830]|uniref:DUF803-domain-containing protein n=1 Tax=Serendipita vermifera MAFF 305830 TaxID=933852 RepID=A0A0C2WZI4_SERVB|nr:hypothetical protein M408DRAFT_260161 [Serendipita vermifera MAFF 305830]